MNDLNYYLTQVEEIFKEEVFMAEPENLYAPIDYTLRLGGKRIRPTLLLAANAMFGGEASAVRNAALGIETFHNFTLLHDDLMDRSPLRRGQPTVYTKWDANTAILSGDTMFALAWRYFLRQPTPQLQAILQCFCETAIEVCEGQQYDMDFENIAIVQLDEYMMMIRKKTAVLLAGALKIGALYANAPSDDIDRLYQYGIHLGLAFQLQDDLLDGYGDTAVFGKKTGQDIRDNKKTYLPILASQICSPTQQAELTKLFDKTNAIDEEEKVKQVLSIYENIGLKQRVESAIEKEYLQAIDYLNQIDVPESGKKPLIEMVETLKGRKK